MPKKPDTARRIVDAALTLAARQPWRRTSLADIAAEAGLPILAVYEVYRSKGDILAAFQRRIDAEVLADAEADRDQRSRDRLFDTIMRRFDALAPHKEAVRELTRDALTDPSSLRVAPGLLQSMAWMLEASGIPASGWRGALRVQMMAGIYLSVLRVWLGDDSLDMTRTMAVLDRRLRRVERWFGIEQGDAAEAASR